MSISGGRCSSAAESPPAPLAQGRAGRRGLAGSSTRPRAEERCGGAEGCDRARRRTPPPGREVSSARLPSQALSPTWCLGGARRGRPAVRGRVVGVGRQGQQVSMVARSLRGRLNLGEPSRQEERERVWGSGPCPPAPVLPQVMRPPSPQEEAPTTRTLEGAAGRGGGTTRAPGSEAASQVVRAAHLCDQASEMRRRKRSSSFVSCRLSPVATLTKVLKKEEKGKKRPLRIVSR